LLGEDGQRQFLCFEVTFDFEKAFVEKVLGVEDFDEAVEELLIV
jgi:hypothetical protein